MTVSINSYLVLIQYKAINTNKCKAINHHNQVPTSQFENGVGASCFLVFKRAREKEVRKKEEQSVKGVLRPHSLPLLPSLSRPFLLLMLHCFQGIVSSTP